MTPSLSAILIAKDEERDLPGCLTAIKGLASEIVVIISDDTTDRTEAVSKEHGAKTVRRKFDDYARQRQASLDMATGDWCLWIDPDERMTPELADEIRAEIRSPRADAYDIPFKVRFLGREMRWGGLGSESHIRLFRREKARFVGGALHEGLELDGETARLTNRIIHEPYRDVGDYLSKLDRYTTLAARKRYDAGRRATIFNHVIPVWEFFARFVIKLGFIDGRQGLIWAVLSAFHTWLKYVKLAEMSKENPR